MAVTYPELARLALLPKAGWHFQALADEDKQLTCVAGWHAQGDTTDALWIYDRTDCLAVRLVSDGLVWRHGGDLSSCIAELLALPHPDSRLAPRLVKACAPGLWTP